VKARWRWEDVERCGRRFLSFTLSEVRRNGLCTEKWAVLISAVCLAQEQRNEHPHKVCRISLSWKSRPDTD
jgi:hypothetical protein